MDKVSGLVAVATPQLDGPWCLAIGFSVRALAQALNTAGFSVIAVDAFGDQDTRESSKVLQIAPNWGAKFQENWLESLFGRQIGPASLHYIAQKGLNGVAERAAFQGEAKNSIPVPVFLGGGCENWQPLLEYLHSKPCLSVTAPPVAAMNWLRDPKNLHHLLGEISALLEGRIAMPECAWDFSTELPGTELSGTEGVATPGGLVGSEVMDVLDTLPDSPRFIVKRACSAGGLGVSWHSPNHPLAAGSYLQQFRRGRVLGVSCLVAAYADSVTVKLVGATESWSAEDWPGPTAFIYRGSFGPIQLSQPQSIAIVRLVQATVMRCVELGLATAPEMAGWMQLDLIEDLQGKLWLLEFNPRWTAGMEVLRLAGLANMAELHFQAWQSSRTAQLSASDQLPKESQVAQHEASGRLVGKAIYYAPRDIELTPAVLEAIYSLRALGLCDLPSREQVHHTVSAGHPLLTLVTELSIPQADSRLSDTALADPSLADSNGVRLQLLQQLSEKRRQLERSVLHLS